ncbi:MAG: hypothetical protein U1D70_04275 [Methylobacter sp.]|nr:hypothetical protein [Methylobacter sp.]
MTIAAYFGQAERQSINESHLSDLKQAASKMGLADRRAGVSSRDGTQVLWR